MEHNTILLAAPFFVAYFIKAWFESTLACTVFNIFRSKKNKMYSFSDFENWILGKSLTLHSLLTCPICVALHLSYTTVIALSAVNYWLKGATPDVVLAIVTVSASAFFGAFINSPAGSVREIAKPVEKKQRKKKVKEATVVEEVKTPAAEKPSTPILEKPTEIKDLGGYLVEIHSSGKTKLLGQTYIMEKYASKVFDATLPCDFAGCEEYRNRFQNELAIMEASYAEKGAKCPECNKSGLKRKFYDIIKAEVESSQT